jgi:uncharacterized protein YndB with AHSA1/START domain
MAGTIRVAAAALALVAAASCQRETFDWEQPEDFKLVETTETLRDSSVEMRFVSLVNAPAEDLYRALSDVEHHAEFVEGVMESRLLGADGNKRTVEIINTVLGRPNRAKIEWTLDEPNLTVSFRTLEAEFTDNSAEYKIEPSPDGKRARVVTVYHLREKGGPFPLHSLKTAIVDSYVAAVRGIKRRALGPKAVVGPRKKQ